MKSFLIVLSFFLIALHAISGVHIAVNNTVVSLDSLELCPDFITVTPVGDCGSFLFNLNHIGDFGNMIWNWGDGGSNSGANNVGHTFFEPGEYTVCVQAWTGDCPTGVEVCTTVFVPDCEFECPEGIVATELECGLWSFALYPGNAVSGGNWVFGDGQFAEVSGNTVTHEFSESGEYMVQANSSLSQGCFNNYFTVTIEVEVCDSGCGLEVDTLSLDGNILVMGASGYPDNAQVHWELNGTIVNIGSVTTFELQPGENEICVYYETPECPQGVFWCESFFIEDSADCPFELIVEETDECGCYDFSISQSGAAGQYVWNMGDTLYSTFSHTTTYCFEPGFQTMYVQLMGSNYPDCENAPLVYQWEVPNCDDPDCYWFAFEIATNIPGVAFDLDWSFTELNGDVAGNGTIQVEGDTTVYSGEVCIGIGCYILEFTAPLSINLENLDIDFVSIIDPSIPVTIEWNQDDNPYTVHAQIGIAATCNWTVSVDENALGRTQIFPVPAYDVLNIELGQEMQTNLRLFSVSGQLVSEQSIQQSGPIDVSALPAGLYLLQLQQGNDFKTFSIPLLN